MVHAMYRPDQKQNFKLIRHGMVDGQPAVRRRKGTQLSQHHLESDSENISSPTQKLDHQIRLWVDENGEIQTESAPTISDGTRIYILEEAVRRFQKVLGNMMLNINQCPLDAKAEVVVGQTPCTRTLCLPREDFHASNPGCPAPSTQQFKRPYKRRRSNSEDSSSHLQDDSSSHGTEQLTTDERDKARDRLKGIEVKDHAKLKEYLYDAFTSFQQINCRTLCKSWIRIIEPKKQVNHPYNGNLKVKGFQKIPPKDSYAQKDSDPEGTKPKWWPPFDECPHKEPDHIKKDQRLALLCHILMNTGVLHQRSTGELKNAIELDRPKIKPADKFMILDDVWKVGHGLERYRKGEIDGASEVYLTPRKEEARMVRGGGRSRKAADVKGDTDDLESSEDTEVGLEEATAMTPTTSADLYSSAPYWHADQDPGSAHADAEGLQYAEDHSAHPFQSTYDNCIYQGHQGEYSLPTEVNSTVAGIPHHGSSEQAFEGHNLGANPYMHMQDMQSHVGRFSPHEQQVVGQWPTLPNPAASDIFPMHYPGEASQPPVAHPSDGDQVYGHFLYADSHKQAYLHNAQGYLGDHNQPLEGFEEDPARFQQVNSYSFPPVLAQEGHPAGMMRQYPYDLPSHVRV